MCIYIYVSYTTIAIILLLIITMMMMMIIIIVFIISIHAESQAPPPPPPQQKRKAIAGAAGEGAELRALLLLRQTRGVETKSFKVVALYICVYIQKIYMYVSVYIHIRI